jgi:release factor glutamine methyltransferase
MAHIEQVLRTARQQLKNSPSAKLDAELLLRQLTGYSAAELITRANETLSDEHHQQFMNLVERRKQGEPIAHIIGQRDFWTLNLAVTKHTLIPRPETELLVELALSHIDKDLKQSVVDLGTGSGAIAIAIKKECPQCEVTASDSSLDALLVAQQNARANNTTITLTQSHWFDQLGAQTYDMVVSNPPYVCDADPHLQHKSRRRRSG